MTLFLRCKRISVVNKADSKKFNVVRAKLILDSFIFVVNKRVEMEGIRH